MLFIISHQLVKLLDQPPNCSGNEVTNRECGNIHARQIPPIADREEPEVEQRAVNDCTSTLSLVFGSEVEVAEMVDRPIPSGALEILLKIHRPNPVTGAAVVMREKPLRTGKESTDRMGSL